MPPIRLRFIAPAVGLAALATSPLALAQSESTEAAIEEAIEEVVVTGTRIRGAEAPVGADIISFDRDYIEDSPTVSVDKLLHEVPQVMNMGVSEASRDQAGGNGNIVYGNAVNLRGIGPFATLVLIDGHRPVTNSVNLEPSVLPTLALERMEILPGGASAVYGSDAIAGVVNLVMRRNVDGGQVLLQGGVGEDYDTHRLGASWGTTFDKGQFFGAVERSFRSNLSSDDRDYITALQPTADYRSSQCDPGNILADDQTYAIPEGGVTPANAGELTAGTRNRCEPFAGEDLLPEQQYTNAAATFNYEITDLVEVYADAFWSEREFKREPGHQRGTLPVDSSNPWFVDPTGTGLSEVTVQYSFADDLPMNTQTGSVEAYQLTTGVKVDLPADWRLDTLVSYGENEEWSSTTRGLDSRGSLPAALASSDPATAFDPFGLHRTSDSVLQAISDQVFIVDDKVEFTGAELRFDGPLFELPGGTVQLATGYEYQDMNSLPTTKRGDPTASFDCAPCNVAGVDELERTVDSVYAELLIPIFGAGNAVSGIESLNLRAAWRKDDYSDVGDTSNPQVGINWVPVDGLTLRASYGESFRAPLFASLYGNSSFLPVEEFSDPTSPTGVTTGVFQTGGNPNLEPETATTQSFGFDWQPAAFPGAQLSMTYFDVEYDQQIANFLGDNDILNREDIFEGTGIILRDEAAAERIQELQDQGLLVRLGVLPDPPTLYVDGRPQNLGVSHTKGIDFSGQYQLDTDTGVYAFRLGGMYITDYERAVTPTSEMLDRRNVIFNPHTLRLRASMDWFRDSYGARVVLNHLGSYENDNVTPSETVSSYNPVDISVWTELGDPNGSGLTDALKLSLAVTNVFDEDPPYVNIRLGYDPTAHNPVGRLLNLSLEKRF